MNDDASAVAKLGEMLRGIEIAMMTTLDADGTLRSRPMAAREAEFDGHLWFFTHASAPKVDEIDHDHQVNLSYADPSRQRYVSVSGRAQLVRNAAKNEELWSPSLKTWFPNGPRDPDTALLKVTVEKAEYWDTPSGTMVHLLDLVKSLVSDVAPRSGEHAKMSMPARPGTL